MLRFVPRASSEPRFEKPDSMSDMLYRLLAARGVSTSEEAEAFLHPSAAQLHDPFLLSDMDRAVETVRAAKDEGKRICVYGDYDVDGVCASAILYLYLKSEGYDCEVYIPSRHEEGYGLNETAVRELAQRCAVLLTVDNGVAARELIALAQSLGMNCVVTDHHRIEGELPPCPTVDPLLNGYPFGFICGAGVAFKLVWALSDLETALEYIDLAALATVADVVPLKDENRAIVSLGLGRMNLSPRPGVAELMKVSGIAPGKLRAQQIAFALAPRLNAGGRLGSALRSFELLTAADEFDAAMLAEDLNAENNARKEVENAMRGEALMQIAGMDLTKHGILLVKGVNWNKGVIGLMAGRIKEKFNYPVIALAEQDGELTGSCRSIEGADIFKALESVSDKLTRYGGHALAAGLTLKAEDFDEVWLGLDNWFKRNVPPERYIPTVEYDLELPIGAAGEQEIKELDALEPTGAGNPAPLFMARVHVDESRAVGSNRAHLQLTVSQDGARRKCIRFGEGALAGRLGESSEIAYVPELNSWNGRVSVELRIGALRSADPEQRLAALGGDGGEALKRAFLKTLFLEHGAKPSRTVGRMTRRALCDQLKNSPFGTWILCMDAAQASALAGELPPGSFDICIGELPDDPRCFNALILSPGTLGPVPRGVNRLVVCGAPAPDRLFGAAPLYELDGSPIPDTAPPGIDALRELFKAARQIVRTGERVSDIERLAQRLSEISGLGRTECLKGMLVLVGAGLFTLTDAPFALELISGAKASPERTEIYQALAQSAQHAYEGVDKV